MTFIEFVTFFKIKKATSSLKRKDVLNNILENTFTYKSDSDFTTKVGVLNLQPTMGTLCVKYNHILI